MARITTSSSAAAMSTAAVGESPKMVVRSTTVERGRAEAPSSRRSSVFTELELLERSVVTLPEALPPGVVTVPLAAGAGALGLSAGAGAEDVELDDEDVPWARTSETGAASRAAPSRAANKDFIPHLLSRFGSKAGASDRGWEEPPHEHVGNTARAVQRRDLVRRSQRRPGPGSLARLPLRRPDADVRRRAGSRQPDRQRAARAGRADGRPRARPLSRHAGVPRRLLGRHQDRRDPDPREHADAQRGLPVLPAGQPREGRGDLGPAAGGGGAGARAGATPAPRARGRRRAGSAFVVRERRGEGLGAPGGRRHLEGRRGVLALLFGLHRPPEGRGAPASRHGGLLRDVRGAGPPHACRRQGILRGQALLLLWARERRLLTDGRRRSVRAL